MKRYLKSILLPLVAALIWGVAFVFQGDAAEIIEPFTFNASRSVVAFVTLLLFLGVRRLMRSLAAKRGKYTETAKPESRKMLFLGGFCCGTALTVASFLQQFGLGGTSPGKSAFITALYVVLVPVLGLFLRKKVPLILWGSVALAVVGLYFLCVDESLRLSDAMLLLGALCYAVHILTIDRFSADVDGFRLSAVQFLTMSVESGIAMLLLEKPDFATVLSCLVPILYVGILSSGVAYTLQILAQKDSNPTVVSLILCLESVFAVLSEALIRNEIMRPKELAGCAVMLIAIVLAQLPESVWQRGKKKIQ